TRRSSDLAAYGTVRRRRNFGLRVRAVGEKHARDVAAALLAAIERAAVNECPAQVFASDRTTQLRQRQEERVVRRIEQSPFGELRSHRRDERVAEREDSHDLELRLLAKTAEEPDPPQQEAQDRATRAVDARRERFDHRSEERRVGKECRSRWYGRS